jgi:hypothetical protein
MYYLLLDGAQSGPFQLAQLIELWRAQRINPLTLYWEEGNADWLPLHNIAPLLEMPPRPAAMAPPSPPTTSPPPLVEPIKPAPSAAPSEEDVLWTRHPTFWHWTGTIIWGLILTPILIGIPILIYVLCTRNATRYRVTRSRVGVQAGIFTRSSRELRIVDIRSIGARANLFGIGDVEFSTAARDEAEVVFRGLARVEEVRDFVKQLQNVQGQSFGVD